MRSQAQAGPASQRLAVVAALRAWSRPPVLQVLAVLVLVLVLRASRAAPTQRVLPVLTRQASLVGPLRQVVPVTLAGSMQQVQPEALVQKRSPGATTPQASRERHPL